MGVFMGARLPVPDKQLQLLQFLSPTHPGVNEML
jgi:hypothetical protein